MMNFSERENFTIIVQFAEREEIERDGNSCSNGPEQGTTADGENFLKVIASSFHYALNIEGNLEALVRQLCRKIHTATLHKRGEKTEKEGGGKDSIQASSMFQPFIIS